MKADRKGWRCGACALLAGGMLLLLIAGLVYYFYIGPKMLNEKRALSHPPSVLVRTPQAGEAVAPGSSLLTQAAVTGTNPIASVELWLDGELITRQAPGWPGQTNMYAFHELQVSAGTHLLHWRAIDSLGLVGQSAPIPIAAAGTLTVSASQGQSLQDIANAEGLDLGELQDLNPGLGEGNLPAGTSVTLPGDMSPQDLPGNAPTPALPDPPPGIPILLPADPPAIDLGSLIPILLANMPSAPSALQAGFQPCTIRLVWNDNAANETGFTVWMQALGGPPLNIASLQPRPGTGQAWFEFASPGFGIYSFWVEAVNGLGAQPSEIAWVAVNDASCTQGLASQLEIEALRMVGFGGGGWRDLYCYLSIEGSPEKRVPADDTQFLGLDVSGGADIHHWIGGRNRILINIPADQEVTLEGDCWGWLADGPAGMGTFVVSVPMAHWDNRTLQAQSTNYSIDFRIRPLGATQANGAFTWLDPGIPAPYGLSVDEIKVDYDPQVTEKRMRTPTVRWQWAGNLQQISGFTLYVDGARAAWVQPIGKILPGNPSTSSHQATLLLPSACGVSYQIQAAASSKSAQSQLSPPQEYRQLPCDYQSTAQSFPVYWSYDASTDANELWLVSADSSGAEVVELVNQDLTTWVGGQAGTSTYRQSGVIHPRRLHNPADEPNVVPYYYFRYVQQKLEFSGQPIYYDEPAVSESFSVGVNHLGSGWRLLRETMYLFDGSSFPTSRFEQVYRGPDGQLYIYRPTNRDLKLLWDAINEGYGYYELSEFD